MDRKEILTIDEYKKYEDNINKMSCLALMNTHLELLNKKVVGKYITIDDCGIEFIKKILNADFGCSYVYYYPAEVEIFIKSNYLSEYFKRSIKNLLGLNIEKNVNDILKKKTKINDLSSEEIKLLYVAINKYYKYKPNNQNNVASLFISYLFHLNGSGVIEYLKNNIDPNILGDYILLTSGLNNRCSYYSSSNVNLSELNATNLISIYEKLAKYDNQYALEFIKLINNIDLLTAQNFINEFEKFVSNNFRVTLTVDMNKEYKGNKETYIFSSAIDNGEYNNKLTLSIKNSFHEALNQKKLELIRFIN